MNFLVLLLRILLFILLVIFMIILLVKNPSTINILIFCFSIIMLFIRYKFNKFLFEYFTNRFLRTIFSVGLVYDFIFTVTLLTIIIIALYFNSDDNSKKDATNELLLDKLVLKTNTGVNEKTIPVEKISKPESPIYSYAFSAYLNDAAMIKMSGQPERKYLFQRKDDKCPKTGLSFNYSDDTTENTNGRNIGLRMGNIVTSDGKNDFKTLYLDYATEESGITKFYTTQVITYFPTRTWMNIVITVDKDIINIYINGTKLTTQVYNKYLKTPSASTPIEFGNMDAHLANLYHSTSAVAPEPSFIERLSKVDEINV